MPDSRAWLRPLLVFVASAVLFGVLAGDSLWRPSANNHFVHLAHGWMDGRLHHEGKPPGYCDAKRRRAKKCRYHQFDDWAVLKTLELEDGSVVRAYPCRTKDCAEARKTERVETWYVAGQGWRSFERGSVRRKDETWYISFPPGPAVAMLPFVAVWGLGTLDVLLTVLLGALLPAVLLAFLDRTRREPDARRENLWLALAIGVGSPACLLACNGSVWFTAQLCGALALTAYLSCAWDLHRPTWAGVWLGIAVACRPDMALAAVFFGWEWWRRGRSWPVLMRFVGPVLLLGAALMAYNLARFDDPFEFGHRFLEIRWQPRIQQYGLFHPRYVVRNLECMLWLMPQQLWPMKVSLHGSAVWLMAPWMLLVVLLRRRVPQTWGLVATVLVLMLPALLYQNSGQTQPTYRFAVVWLPAFALLLAHGRALRVRRLFVPLVIIAMLMQSWAGWMFVRHKAKLFVTDPLGWPFQAEFDEV